jgi:hypothetical protein
MTSASDPLLWTQTVDQVDFHDDSESVYYKGTIFPGGIYMEGTMSITQGMSGCWNANRQE